MKTFHMRNEHRSGSHPLRAIIVSASALLVLISICAFPLPELLKDVRLESRIKVLEQQRFELEQLDKRSTGILDTLPGNLKTLIRKINKALPCVDSVLTLRDLILAQADFVGVEIHYFPFPPDPVSLGREIPCEGGGHLVLGSVDMELGGTALLENIFRFMELIEAANDTYVIDDFTLTPVSSGTPVSAAEDQFTLQLGLRAFFRADPEQMINPLSLKKEPR